MNLLLGITAFIMPSALAVCWFVWQSGVLATPDHTAEGSD